MSLIGLRVGPFEITGEATVPESGAWYSAKRGADSRKTPAMALVKVIGDDAPAEARALLQKEHEALRALDGGHVPEVIGLFDGLGALVVGAVEGVPLSAMVARRKAGELPMTPATLLDIGLEISEAIQMAHHKGRHHGHLSPEQVILGPDGRVTIWGFGPGARGVPAAGWLAPERARGEPITGATDQWALGAILAALITGHAPWRGEDPEAEARRGDPAQAVGPVNAQWPAFGRLIRKLLDPRPASRFSSIHPVRQDLYALSRKAGGVSERRELGSRLWAEWQQREPEPDVPQYDLPEDSPPPAAPGAGSPRPSPLNLDGDGTKPHSHRSVDPWISQSEGSEAANEPLRPMNPATPSPLLAAMVNDDYTAERSIEDDHDEPVPAWLSGDPSPSISEVATAQAPPGMRPSFSTGRRPEEEEATQLYTGPPPALAPKAPAALPAALPSGRGPAERIDTLDEDEATSGGHVGPPSISAIGAPSLHGDDPFEVAGPAVRPTAFVRPRIATPTPIAADTADTAVPYTTDIPTVIEDEDDLPTSKRGRTYGDASGSGPSLGEPGDAVAPLPPREAAPIARYALALVGLMVVMGVLSLLVQCLG